VAALGVVDRALDGTPLYAARGKLPADVDTSSACSATCAAAGITRWAPATLWRVHGVTADEYGALVGLRPRHPCGPRT
jgi:hypothetical protein